MSTEVQEPRLVLSAAEEAFERWRRRAGLVVAPLVFGVLWFCPVGGVSPQADRLLAILGLVVVLWMTEALPMAVTALLGPTLCVLAGIAPAQEVFRPFADPIIFLFMGSFMLVEAMMKHGLNRRLAFLFLGMRSIAESPLRLYAAFGFIAVFLSMWVSNAATTAMLLPIGIAIATEVARRESVRRGVTLEFTRLPLATGLMLLTAFGASVGGLATPIGTPPNLIGIGMIERMLGTRLSFVEWMRVGLPVSLVLGVFLVVNFHRRCAVPASSLQGGAAWLAAENARLGPWTPGQRNVLIVFGAAVCCWLIPGVLTLVLGATAPAIRSFNARMPESMVALCAALVLFAWPLDWREARFTLSWTDAVKIDWGTIFLFAGGMALGEQMFSTGLARWVGDGLAGIFQARTALGMTLLFTAVAIVTSEATSNTASATMVVPVAIAVAQAAGVDPMQPALGACIGASMGFLLPVSTGPNAIVYGSGCVPLVQMMRHGILLDLFGFVVIVAVVTLLSPS
ncbi:MAG: DASS family sodium-coupled anion symporter [Verrucomicrobiae bacterium]|nr:DASS family sodium-coupled anion symporter [Verrucomicrobiae bacterium]